MPTGCAIACAVVLWLAEPGAAQGPVRRDRLLTIAKAIEQAANDRDVAALDARVDRAGLVERALAGVPATVGERLVIGRDLRHDLKVGRMIVAALGDTGHARLLAVRERAGGPRALFRVVRDVTGLNYYEVLFGPPGQGGQGEVKIVDVYTYRGGELLSAALHRACTRHLYADRGWHEWIPPAARMDELIERGWFAEALRYAGGLPPDDRDDRTVLLQRLLCAGRVSGEATQAAWTDLRRAWPDEPGADLFVLPGLLEHQRLADALAAVERLRVLVHDDPYLDALAGRALLDAGGLDRARGFIERVVKAEPDLELAWTLRLRLSLAQHEHRQTAETLAVLRQRFGYRFQHLDTNPDYQAFVQSEAYTPR